MGSESSSGGGAWKSENLGTWKSGDLQIWRPGDPEIWRSRDLEIQKVGVQQIQKYELSKFKSVLPKMSARSGFVGKNVLLAPVGAISLNFFYGPEKLKKSNMFAYFPWWDNGHYLPGLGACAGVILTLRNSLL